MIWSFIIRFGKDKEKKQSNGRRSLKESYMVKALEFIERDLGLGFYIWLVYVYILE